MGRKLYGSIIITYRCNAHCNMCDCWKYPSKSEEEITLHVIRKLPEMAFTNVTGGEPFVRSDIDQIVRELYKKTNRIVISTNGYFTDRILKLCKEFPKVGIRISIEGLQESNDRIRGIPYGFNRGYETLKSLVELGHPDVGFGMTVQDINADDLIKLYKLSEELGMEFATATLHNSFYFRKNDNIINDKLHVAKCFDELINKMLKSKSPKQWFRAYFNYGLINYIYSRKRLLPCKMASDAFFVDPFGNVLPCNGSKEPIIMGNLSEKTWDELWHSKQAERAREIVRNCDRNCWMIGSAAPEMKHKIIIPAWWIFRQKLKGGYRFSEEEFLNG